jgi:hypothetical protein
MTVARGARTQCGRAHRGLAKQMHYYASMFIYRTQREIETRTGKMLSLVRRLINRCRQRTKLNIYRTQTSRILRNG